MIGHVAGGENAGRSFGRLTVLRLTTM